jgi:hypothetical protein
MRIVKLICDSDRVRKGLPPPLSKGGDLESVTQVCSVVELDPGV